jgi:hypothetical protein
MDRIMTNKERKELIDETLDKISGPVVVALETSEDNLTRLYYRVCTTISQHGGVPDQTIKDIRSLFEGAIKDANTLHLETASDIADRIVG